MRNILQVLSRVEVLVLSKVEVLVLSRVEVLVLSKVEVLTVLLLLCATTINAQRRADLCETYSYVRQDGKKARIRLKHVNDTLNIIQYYVGRKKSDEWVLRFPVYQFRCGDINGDTIPEIAVGVIKSARYSQYVSRRLFLFKLYDEKYVRPLWLGSRMAHDLIDYDLDITDAHRYITTTERTTKGDTVRVCYKTSGFGIKFVEYR